MKTFVWIIGKPGSGKTTIGDAISNLKDGIVHYSYGQLLKEIQPNPPADGYSMVDREKVNEIILQASQNHSIVVVDGNPYSQIGFGFIEQIRSGFDQIKVIHLCINDQEALSRLKQRGREVLAHDGSLQEDRIKNFNERLLPLIQEYCKRSPVTEIDVSSSDSIDEVTQKVSKGII
jgi:adenylate kinase family enzyme